MVSLPMPRIGVGKFVASYRSEYIYSRVIDCVTRVSAHDIST